MSSTKWRSPPDDDQRAAVSGRQQGCQGTRQTAAQSGVAVCTHFTPATNQNVAAWMNAQQASGRLKFISHQDVLCAW
jgi:hypothetical protein